MLLLAWIEEGKVLAPSDLHGTGMEWDRDRFFLFQMLLCREPSLKNQISPVINKTSSSLDLWDPWSRNIFGALLGVSGRN